MKTKGILHVLTVVVWVAGAAWADPCIGVYKGTFHPDNQVSMEAVAKVIAEADDVHYRIVLSASPKDKGPDGADIEVYAHRDGAALLIGDRAGGYYWRGELHNGHLSLASEYGQNWQLDKTQLKSPQEGLTPPDGAVILLGRTDGGADLRAWTNQEWKALDGGVMQINKGSTRTKEQFGDIEHLHLEFKLPLEPNNRGQNRCNSGMFLCGLYEVQILDSFGLTHTSGDCGGLYGVRRTRVNACYPPLTWQTYDVKFTAARLNDDGSVKANARITAHLNGVLIHDDVEIPHPTANPSADVKAAGPIELQDHGHPIQFRNIWLVRGK